MQAQDAFIYFAYGSNMATRRLQARTPSAQPLGIATLPGWQLNFHKKASDGSGKCSISPSDAPHAQVHGMLYALSLSEKPILDAAEGLGRDYDLHTLVVQTPSQSITVSAYIACALDATVLAYPWYLDFVVRGAMEHGLPAAYIAQLQTTSTQDDPDPQRQQRNARILGHTSDL